MSEETLYMQLVREWTELIGAGTVRPGERLPSVRKACALHKVSPSTVLATYRTLEERGLIEARPQSGFYVRAKAALPLPRMGRRSEALRVEDAATDQLEQVMAAQSRPDVIDLSLASPRGSDFYPTTRLKAIMGQLLRRHPELTTDYPFPPGSERLRRQIAQRALSRACVMAPGDIVVTNGCSEALQLALRAVCKAGDTVALESPTYFALIPLAQSLGLTVIEVPTHPSDGVSVDAIELLLSEQRLAAIVVQPVVQNPLGATMPLEARQRLARLAAEYKVAVIEDAPHAELYYDGASLPEAVRAFDEEGWVLLCSSFSKTLAPGFRIGWIAPGRFLHRVLQLKIAGSLGQPGLLEETLASYLEGGSYEPHLRFIRRQFMGQMTRLRGEVAARFPEGTRASSPSGGCLLWVELPKGVDTLALFRQALAEGITVAPGALYSARGRYSHCVRLSCCYPWSDAYERALARFAELTRQAAP